ncbi:MAG: phospholipase/carboxylesterase [Acidobacteria bacterium]|nr:phospholipase/carboxylesterase [Acidobacteriota bacterium]
MTTTSHDDLSLRYVKSVPSRQSDQALLPLVVCMHGRGADANDLAGVAPTIDGAGGYRFIFPNAAKPFEPYPGMRYGWSWFEGWPPAPGTIADSRQAILTFLDEIVARYPTPAGKVALAGFSQGGLMALDAGFRTKEPLAALVVMSGAIYEADLPDLKARREQPVLLVHGTQDEVIPVLAARRTRLVLEEHGIRPEYGEFPMGHFVTPESLQTVSAFLARHL